MASLLLDELTVSKDLEGLPVSLVIKSISQHCPKPLVSHHLKNTHDLLNRIAFSPINSNGTVHVIQLTLLALSVLYKKRDLRHPSHPHITLIVDPEKSPIAYKAGSQYVGEERFLTIPEQNRMACPEKISQALLSFLHHVMERK